MEESELHRTRSKVLSGRSLQEVGRLSAELEAEAARARLLSAQPGGPTDILRAVSAQLGSACACFLECGEGWRTATDRAVVLSPAGIGLLLEQLSLREIYVQHPSRRPLRPLTGCRWTAEASSRGTPCDSPPDSSGPPRGTSSSSPSSRYQTTIYFGRHLLQGVVWMLSGKESGAIVLSVEQQPHWRRYLETASAALLKAIETADRESALRRKAEVGETVRELCLTLFCSPETPPVTLRSLPGVFESALTDCSCELFLSDSRSSCIDSAGAVHSLGGLVREVFLSGASQVCRDTSAEGTLSMQLDCGGRGDVRAVAVLPVSSTDDLSSVLVFRFKSGVDDATVSLCSDLVESAKPFLQTWCAQHRNEFAKIHPVQSGDSTIERLEVMRTAIEGLLASGEHALDNAELLNLIAKSFDCEWAMVILFDHSHARLFGGAKDVLNLDELKGSLLETIESMTDVNRIPLSHTTPIILNSLDTKQSGLQSLLRLRLNPYCNCLAFHLVTLGQLEGLSSEERVFAVVLCGRSWGAFVLATVQSISLNLSRIYAGLLQFRRSGSASSSAYQSLSLERNLREAFGRKLETFRQTFSIEKQVDMTPKAFRSLLVAALREFGEDLTMGAIRFDAGLLLYGALSQSKWELDASGEWTRDRSFSRKPNRGDILHCYNKRSRRYLAFEASCLGVEIFVVLDVKPIGENVVLLSQQLPQLALMLSSIFHTHSISLFSIEESYSIDLSKHMPGLVEEFQLKGQISEAKTIVQMENSSILYSLPIYVDADGGTLDVRHDTRALPPGLRTQVLNIVGQHQRFHHCFDDHFSNIIFEYIHSFDDTPGSVDVIVCMHVSFSIALNTAIVVICLYDEGAMTTPMSLEAYHNTIHSRADLFMVLQAIRPHVAPLNEHEKLKVRNASFTSLLGDFCSLYNLRENGDDPSAMLRTILLCATYHSRLLAGILGGLSRNGLQELISEIVRAVSAKMIKCSDKNDIVIHWTTEISSISTAGLISIDMADLVRTSGRLLEVDVDHPSLSAPREAGALRTRNAKIALLPVCPQRDYKSPPEVLGVLQLILPAGTPIDENVVISLMREALQRLANEAPQGLSSLSGGQLSSICSALISAKDIQALRMYMDNSFITSFSAFLGEQLHADCGIFLKQNFKHEAVIEQGNIELTATVHSWKDGAVVLLNDAVSVPLKTLQNYNASDTNCSVLSQSLLTASSCSRSAQTYCFVFEVSEATRGEAYIVIESAIKLSTADRRFMIAAKDLYLLLLTFASTR